MNESLRTILSQLRLGDILTRSRNIVEDRWIESWLDGSTDSKRLMEIIGIYVNNG